MQIDRTYLEQTLAALVRINSVNPKFSDGSTDELAIATHLDGVMRALGMEVTLYDSAPRRTSVVGRLRGGGGGRSLMLYGHIDTVGIDEMRAPLSARIRDGRMYGRGTYDMKGGVAACIAAVKAIVDSGSGLAGDVVVVGAADEEVASTGMAEVLKHVHTDAAIVTESTELHLCLAHKGFCWMEVEVEGRAAHGSRFEEGIDANMAMGRFLGRLDTLERELRTRTPHALVGPPSLHAAVILGGSGTSTYAAHCRLEIERRTIPGETEAGALAEIQSILDALASNDSTFRARVRPLLSARIVRGTSGFGHRASGPGGGDRRARCAANDHRRAVLDGCGTARGCGNRDRRDRSEWRWCARGQGVGRSRVRRERRRRFSHARRSIIARLSASV